VGGSFTDFFVENPFCTIILVSLLTEHKSEELVNPLRVPPHLNSILDELYILTSEGKIINI